MPIFYGSRYTTSTVTLILPPATETDDTAIRATVLDRKPLTVDDLSSGWAYRQVREKIDLDLLSYNVSGREGLWYVIADINDILDPFIDITAGESLIIPSQQSFNDINASLNSRG